MKVVRWMTAVAGIAFVLSVQAPDRALGAVGDAEIILYRFTGVTDNGGAMNTGVATSFHCTNFSGVIETFRIVVRDTGAGVVANFAINIPHLLTFTFTTHQTNLFASEQPVSPGFVVSAGTAAIAATSVFVVCSAMIVDAASASPVGIALHGIRFNPVPGSQE